MTNPETGEGVTWLSHDMCEANALVCASYHGWYRTQREDANADMYWQLLVTMLRNMRQIHNLETWDVKSYILFPVWEPCKNQPDDWPHPYPLLELSTHS